MRILFTVTLLLFATCLKAGLAVAAEAPPWPWDAVTVTDDGVVSVSERTYDFSKGPLPTSVRSAGGASFVAPARLVIDDDDNAVKWQAPSGIERTPSLVTMTFAGASPGVAWEARVEVAYDGLVWIALTAKGESAEAQLERASLRMAVAADDANIYSHQMVETGVIPGAWRTHFMDMPERLWNAGKTPADGWKGEFTPQLWLGGWERGLAFLAETPETWKVGDDDDILFIEPAAKGRSGMRVDFANRAFAPGDGWSVEFGLMATPVRPPKNRKIAYRVTNTGGGRLEGHLEQYGTEKLEDSKLNLLAQDGAKVVLLWNNWSDLWGFPGITDPKFQRFVHRFVDYAHRLEMKAIVYHGALLQLPTNHPNYKELAGRFTIDKRNRRQNPFAKGVFNYRVVPTPEFNEWYHEQLAAFAKEYDMDGCYLDMICKPDAPLQKDRAFYALRDWRGFFEGIYRTYHGGAKKDGFVYFHDSEPNIFMYNAFADARLSGEMQYYCAASRREATPVMPDLKDRMPPEECFAWTSGAPLGDLPTYWCTKSPWARSYSVGIGKDKSSFQCGEMIQPREIWGLGGLFRIQPGQQHSFRGKAAFYYDQRVHWWRMDDQAEAMGVEWFPLWKADRYVGLDPARDVHASGALAEGKGLLLHVVNFVAEPREVTVTLKPTTGLDKVALTALDQILGEETEGLELGKGTVKVTLGSNSYARILLAPKQ